MAAAAVGGARGLGTPRRRHAVDVITSPCTALAVEEVGVGGGEGDVLAAALGLVLRCLYCTVHSGATPVSGRGPPPLC